MQENLPETKRIRLSIRREDHLEEIAKISNALSSIDRLNILRSLFEPKNLSTLSEELGIPISSVSRHIETLEDAGLIHIYHYPNQKGRKKYSLQTMLRISFSLYEGFDAPPSKQPMYEAQTVDMPIGLFSHCHIEAPCGMVGKKHNLNKFDVPDIFFDPVRVNAELVWFNKGFISYNFPTKPLKHHPCSSIAFSFEICSETPSYNNNWPSDITISINDIEILTFTSPGDFGGRRGRFTPEFWPIVNTQFGLLKKILVNEDGVFMDELFVHSDIKFNDLKLYDGTEVKLTIGIKDDAVHSGGINLFGRGFGDHPQAIRMTVQ